MQRVLAVLDDKLPISKSLRRWRTGRVLKSKFAALRDRGWTDLERAIVHAAGH